MTHDDTYDDIVQQCRARLVRLATRARWYVGRARPLAGLSPGFCSPE